MKTKKRSVKNVVLLIFVLFCGIIIAECTFTVRAEAAGKKKNTKKYEGTWYEQKKDGGVLKIEKNSMTYKCSRIDNKTKFTAKKSGKDYNLVPDNEMFYFYEINYVSDDDKIVAYTQPELDGDGGYKQSVFLSEEYVPGEDEILEYLQGEWEIMDDASLIQEPGVERDILYIGDSKYHGASYKKDGDIARFKYSLEDMYDTGSPLYNCLTLFNRGSGDLKYGWDEVRDTQHFQVFLANDRGYDYMFLRELGDERTGFCTDGLEYDRSSMGTWFFRRYNPDEITEDWALDIRMPSTIGKEEELRIKGDSFYALKWQEFGNSCTLQRVEPVNTTFEFTKGKKEKALVFAMPDDEYAYSTVNYEYKGREMYAHDGFFDPAFVYVTTDKKGRITDMSVIDYAYDGYYYDSMTELNLDPDQPVG
ncbi:MAG: hypothetical protein K6G22_03625 [Lachnospiraceae bacterium]|nr:hypothetical protein [Lachnospiraceae bacterium]